VKLEEMPEFIPGLKLCEYFYWEAVRPVLDRHFPALGHAAARLDYGSDVMGFDTPQSRDHGWGPKVSIFLTDADYAAHKDSLHDVLANELPCEVRGYPTNFDHPFSGEGTVVPISQGPVNHWVLLTTIPRFFGWYLGIDPLEPITLVDWLTIPQQHLCTLASGAIYFDGLMQLEAVRERLRWFPGDIWLYLLANQWRRIDQEEPFVGRCGDVGDELGSTIVASRLVAEIMKLCLLMEKAYLPYFKWFGSAFSRLDCAADLTPVFQRVLGSQTWKQREKHLSQAYLRVGEMHNALALTPFIEPQVSNFFNRPYQVPLSARFVEALHEAIQSQAVRALPRHLGSVDQFVDSTELLSSPQSTRGFRDLFSSDE
jgi:hypothetical protein